MNDLGELTRPEVISFHSSRGAMIAARAQNRSGFFRAIRVIVVRPVAVNGADPSARSEMIRAGSKRDHTPSPNSVPSQ